MDFSAVLKTMPYVENHGMEITSTPGEPVVVHMPFKKALENHVQSVHASALFTVGETAAGIEALQTIPDGKAIPILRGAEVAYKRRAASDLVAKAVRDDGAAKAAREAFEAEGKGNLKVKAEVFDAGGEKVFEATFDYALRPVQG